MHEPLLMFATHPAMRILHQMPSRNALGRHTHKARHTNIGWKSGWPVAVPHSRSPACLVMAD